MNFVSGQIFQKILRFCFGALIFNYIYLICQMISGAVSTTQRN